MTELFVDDRQSRIDYFIKNNPHAKIAKNYAEAISLLSSEYFDTVYLDYDLMEDKNGCDIAQFVSERNIQIPKIVIHSWNEQGANCIKSKLSQYNVFMIRFPFNISEEELK